MAKLIKSEIDTLQLIQRSDPDADGWCKVSAACWAIVKNFAPQELIELEYNEETKGGRVRFNERGKIVMEYI